MAKRVSLTSRTVSPAMRYSLSMPAAYEISSPHNERIKRLRRLRDKRHRDDEGVFLVEGVRLISRAVEAGHEPLEMYIDGTVESPGEAIATLVEPSVLDTVSYRKSSQGAIAVFRQWTHRLDDLQLSDPCLVVVAESLEKPGNLGAIARTAAAIGADGLLAVGAPCDPFNPNSIRSSTGAVFSLPVVQSDLLAVGQWLADRSISLIALSPDAPLTIWDADLSGSCALMVGPEDRGLSSIALQLAEMSLSIPMRSDAIDSLNTSVALAVAAYEACRQRSPEVT